MAFRPPEVFAVAEVGEPTAPSLANLEAQMYQNQSVLQGWDAVFMVLEGPVNAFLYQQFQQYISHLGSSNNLMPVSAYYCENVEHVRKDWFTNVTKLTFNLSNPLLQFLPGNDSVTVTQNILSGSVTVGTLTCTEQGFEPGKCTLVDGTVNFTVNQSTSTLTLSVDGVFSNNIQVMLTTTGTLPAPCSQIPTIGSSAGLRLRARPHFSCPTPPAVPRSPSPVREAGRIRLPPTSTGVNRTPWISPRIPTFKGTSPSQRCRAE